MIYHKKPITHGVKDSMQKQAENVDLLMVIEYLTIIEIFKDVAKGQDDAGF